MTSFFPGRASKRGRARPVSSSPIARSPRLQRSRSRTTPASREPPDRVERLSLPAVKLPDIPLQSEMLGHVVEPVDATTLPARAVPPRPAQRRATGQDRRNVAAGAAKAASATGSAAGKIRADPQLPRLRLRAAAARHARATSPCPSRPTPSTTWTRRARRRRRRPAPR